MRPASALKELVENSLDARATEINVQLQDGGMTMLQITDNGHGIRVEDFPILCERFTTSKLRDYTDLRSISTFGFRGEALASLTHVAHVTITSMTPDSQLAYRARFVDSRMVAEDGTDPRPRPCAGVPGTSICAENMFHNIPVRRRALSHYGEEYARCLEVLQCYSIRFPYCAFSCRKRCSVASDFRTPKDSTALANIRTIFGNALARELLPVRAAPQTAMTTDEASQEAKEADFDWGEFATAPFTQDTYNNLGVHLMGYVSNANYGTKKFTFILFINNRLVTCSSIKRAIDSVYSRYLPKNSFPFVYLSLHMPPQNIDVNVHPTKKEVQFLNEELIAELVSSVCERALAGANRSRVFQAQTLRTPIAPITMHDIPSTACRHEQSGTLSRQVTQNVSNQAEQSPSEWTHAEVHDSMNPTCASAEPMESSNAGPIPHSQTESVFTTPSKRDDAPHVDTVGAPSTLATQDAPLRRSNTLALDGAGDADACPHLTPQTGSSTKRQKVSSEATPKPSRMDSSLVRIDALQMHLREMLQPLSKEAVAKSKESTMFQNQGPISLLSATNDGLAETERLSISAPLLPGQRGIEICETILDDMSEAHAFDPSILELTSLIELKQELNAECETSYDRLCSHHTFVGIVTPRFSLVQFGTRLFLLDMPLLSRSFFYSQALHLFGRAPTITFAEPVLVRPLLAIAARSEEAISIRYQLQKGKTIAEVGSLSSYLTIDSDTEVDAVRPFADESELNALVNEEAARLSHLLLEKAPMLREFFALGFGLASQDTDDPDGLALVSIPLLCPKYSPPLAKLPLFMYRLALLVDWTEEKACFQSICRELANFYQFQPDWYLELQGESRPETAESKASMEWQSSDALPASSKVPCSRQDLQPWLDVVSKALLPAMKRCKFVPSRTDIGLGAAIQVACLQDLYKVFERC